MDPQKAEDLARELMAKWLPSYWTFAWNDRTSALGATNHYYSVIKLSRVLCELNPREVIENTIRHEIAHALTGAYDQMGNRIPSHGEEWKENARLVGAAPSYGTRAVRPPRPPHKWEVRCQHCGLVIHKAWRLTKKARRILAQPRACTPCCDKLNGGEYDERFRIRLYQMH